MLGFLNPNSENSKKVARDPSEGHIYGPDKKKVGQACTFFICNTFNSTQTYRRTHKNPFYEPARASKMYTILLCNEKILNNVNPKYG